MTTFKNLELLECTLPLSFIPSTEGEKRLRRQSTVKEYKGYSVGLYFGKWGQKLALASEDVVRNTFEVTTQMVMHFG